MTAITLDQVQAKPEELQKLTTLYRQQLQTRRVEVAVDKRLIDLFPGEEYIGCIINADGSAHAIILLPDDRDDINWADANAWAASLGGTLPNRVEQALLYASHRDKFAQRAYWSCEQYAEDVGYAWSQLFSSGTQDTTTTLTKLRARAVRRVPL